LYFLVGAGTTDAHGECGIYPDFEPSHRKMALVQKTAERAQALFNGK
jgi:hypothetical protein